MILMCVPGGLETTLLVAKTCLLEKHEMEEEDTKVVVRLPEALVLTNQKLAYVCAHATYVT